MIASTSSSAPISRAPGDEIAHQDIVLSTWHTTDLSQLTGWIFNATAHYRLTLTDESRAPLQPRAGSRILFRQHVDRTYTAVFTDTANTPKALHPRIFLGEQLPQIVIP